MNTPLEIVGENVETFVINDTSPADIVRAAEESYMRQRLEKWAQADPQRHPLLPVPWVIPIRQMIHKKGKGWTKRHTNVARCAAVGGYVDQPKLHMTRRATSSALSVSLRKVRICTYITIVRQKRAPSSEPT